MPETSGELPSAEQVEKLTHEERAKRIGVRIALAALVFSICSSIFVWTHSARVARNARADAVAEAARARAEADRGLCALVGLLISADTPERDPRLRAALADAYRAPGCVPPLDAHGRLPSPAPSPSPR